MTMNRFKKMLAASLLLSTSISSADGTPGKFDFYVLVLSWSPDHCATEGKTDSQQCAVGKKLGLVLHGLWPQYNRGFPDRCANDKFTKNLVGKFPNLYPNEKLYAHEWEKHGTCSGLDQEGYLALSQKLKESVSIPKNYQAPSSPFRTTVEALKTKFISANPKLSADGIAVYCSDSGRYLKEVFFCHSRQEEPAACSQEVVKRAEKSCGQPDLLVRNVK